jgi:STE24 endopeptidase
LYDTLIAKMSHEQILAVLAHELGHAKHKDTQKLLAIQNGTMVFYIALDGLHSVYAGVVYTLWV